MDVFELLAGAAMERGRRRGGGDRHGRSPWGGRTWTWRAAV